MPGKGKAAAENPEIKEKKGERAVGRAQVVFKSTEWAGKRESEPVRKWEHSRRSKHTSCWP